MGVSKFVFKIHVHVQDKILGAFKKLFCCHGNLFYHINKGIVIINFIIIGFPFGTIRLPLCEIHDDCSLGELFLLIKHFLMTVKHDGIELRFTQKKSCQLKKDLNPGWMRANQAF